MKEEVAALARVQKKLCCYAEAMEAMRGGEITEPAIDGWAFILHDLASEVYEIMEDLKRSCS